MCGASPKCLDIGTVSTSHLSVLSWGTMPAGADLGASVVLGCRAVLSRAPALPCSFPPALLSTPWSLLCSEFALQWTGGKFYCGRESCPFGPPQSWFPASLAEPPVSQCHSHLGSNSCIRKRSTGPLYRFRDLHQSLEVIFLDWLYKIYNCSHLFIPLLLSSIHKNGCVNHRYISTSF